MNTNDITKTTKKVGNNNPIATQRFMADPYAIEYEGVVYVYGTNDSEQMTDSVSGEIPVNNYSKIRTLNCYSSKDMVNWTDQGVISVAGEDGPAKWATNSWAPAVAYKEIEGQTKFFLYFADNGGGIGVLQADSPTGPWKDPIGKALISRDVPNCSGAEIPWLFDPAVLVDDDGQGYLYFGGIGEAEDREHPKCIHVVKLGDDMISLKEDPVEIDAPAPFEDSGINKINGKYYYSYCTNFDDESTRPTTSDLGIANIAYMISEDPMGVTGWSEAKSVLDNPKSYFPEMPDNDNNNNHYCMFEKSDGNLYIFYHTQKMASDAGNTKGYRTTGVDRVTMGENGELSAAMTMAGVEAVSTFDPYDTIPAATFAWSEGTTTVEGPDHGDARNNRVLLSVDKGAYVGLEAVDFGTLGAKSLTMSVAKENGNGGIEVYLEDCDQRSLVGRLEVTETGSEETFQTLRVNFDKALTGTHRLFFVFDQKDILVDTWKFEQ